MQSSPSHKYVTDFPSFWPFGLVFPIEEQLLFLSVLEKNISPIEHIKYKWFELHFKNRCKKTYCIFYNIHGNLHFKNTYNYLHFITYYPHRKKFSTLHTNNIFVLTRMKKIEDHEILKMLRSKYTQYILRNGLGDEKLES